MAEFSFDINNTQSLFSILLADYEDYKLNTISSKLALRCAMTSWHLVEWVYKEFKPSLVTQFPEIKHYRDWIRRQCTELEIMQDITNGTKHNEITFYSPHVNRTEMHKGVFSPVFSREFDISTLNVHMKDGSKIYFQDAIEAVVNFWTSYLLQEFQIKA